MNTFESANALATTRKELQQLTIVNKKRLSEEAKQLEKEVLEEIESLTRRMKGEAEKGESSCPIAKFSANGKHLLCSIESCLKAIDYLPTRRRLAAVIERLRQAGFQLSVREAEIWYQSSGPQPEYSEPGFEFVISW